MSSEERKKILQMVEEGRISAEQASSLMHALTEDASSPTEVDVIQAGPVSAFDGSESPEFERVRWRARRFAMIPLWAGVFVAVFSAWGLYAVERSAGLNFWFFCLLPLLFVGVLLIALGAGGRNARWLYINVHRQHAHDWPRNITLGLPLPLGPTAWFLRHFGHNIPGMRTTGVDEIIQALEATGRADAPFIVDVNDDGGEHVQVYIG